MNNYLALKTLKRVAGLTCSTLVAFAGVSTSVHSEQLPYGDRAPRVINGSEAPEGEFPFMAALVPTGQSARQYQYCGATVISPEYVMTAAHCVTGGPQITIAPEYVEVVLGSTSLSSPDLRRLAVKSIVAHPQFNDITLENDVALLKLAEPIDVPPVRLATAQESDLYEAGRDATVVGWGKTNPLYNIMPDHLRMGAVPMIDDVTCEENNGRWVEPASMVCAGKLSTSSNITDGVDACNGDSGGPLLVKKDGEWVQVGIVSWGFECASPLTFGVYSRVAALQEWVASDHIFPPTYATPVVVEGKLQVGEKIKCALGQETGDPAETVSYVWFSIDSAETFSNMQEIANGNSQEVTLTSAELGRYVTCNVMASNSGGSVMLNSAPVGPVEAAAPTATPTPTPAAPTPTPTPSLAATPTPTPVVVKPNATPVVDQQAPQLSNSTVMCQFGQCTVLFKVTDTAATGATASGVARVEAVLKYARRPNFSKRLGIKLRRDGTYRIVVRNVPLGRYFIAMTLKDNLGNSATLDNAFLIKIGRGGIRSDIMLRK